MTHKKQPQAPKPSSGIAISNGARRKSQISPERLAIEAVLLRLADLSAEQLADLAKVDLKKTRQVLRTMMEVGKVRRTGEKWKCYTWSASKSLLSMLNQDPPKPLAKVQRHVNSNQGPLDAERKPLMGCALPGSTEYIAPSMSCARGDGNAHLAAKSRRGSELVDYTRPLAIGSSVRGGAA